MEITDEYLITIGWTSTVDTDNTNEFGWGKSKYFINEQHPSVFLMKNERDGGYEFFKKDFVAEPITKRPMVNRSDFEDALMKL